MSNCFEEKYNSSSTSSAPSPFRSQQLSSRLLRSYTDVVVAEVSKCYYQYVTQRDSGGNLRSSLNMECPTVTFGFADVPGRTELSAIRKARQGQPLWILNSESNACIIAGISVSEAVHTDSVVGFIENMKIVKKDRYLAKTKSAWDHPGLLALYASSDGNGCTEYSTIQEAEDMFGESESVGRCARIRRAHRHPTLDIPLPPGVAFGPEEGKEKWINDSSEYAEWLELNEYDEDYTDRERYERYLESDDTAKGKWAVMILVSRIYGYLLGRISPYNYSVAALKLREDSSSSIGSNPSVYITQLMANMIPQLLMSTKARFHIGAARQIYDESLSMLAPILKKHRHSEFLHHLLDNMPTVRDLNKGIVIGYHLADRTDMCHPYKFNPDLVFMGDSRVDTSETIRVRNTLVAHVCEASFRGNTYSNCVIHAYFRADLEVGLAVTTPICEVCKKPSGNLVDDDEYERQVRRMVGWRLLKRNITTYKDKSANNFYSSARMLEYSTHNIGKPYKHTAAFFTDMNYFQRPFEDADAQLEDDDYDYRRSEYAYSGDEHEDESDHEDIAPQVAATDDEVEAEENSDVDDGDDGDLSDSILRRGVEDLEIEEDDD